MCCTNYVRMIFFGAGKCGLEALDIYKRQYNGNLTETIFFDNYKKGNVSGIQILKPFEYKHKTDPVVITVEDYDAAFSIYTDLMGCQFSNIFWFRGIEYQTSGGTFIEEQCVSCKKWDKNTLKQAEVHVMDSCNLNCRGCTHFSPLFKNGMPDFEKRIHGLTILKNRVSHLISLYLLGGEPLLNTELKKYVSYVRQIFPDTEIIIVTNGILIPSMIEELADSIVSNKVKISISEYIPTHKIIDRIENVLRQKKVIYNLRRIDVKLKFNLPLSLGKRSIEEKYCLSNGCVIVHDGKVARCPTLMLINEFNERFETNLPDDGIYDIESMPYGQDFIQLMKQDVPLCRNCVKYHVDWAQCLSEPCIDDWVGENVYTKED